VATQNTSEVLGLGHSIT